ncbi:MAG: hypothetical protein ABIB97_02320 [Patescibacteria group bacterium]
MNQQGTKQLVIIIIIAVVIIGVVVWGYIDLNYQLREETNVTNTNTTAIKNTTVNKGVEETQWSIYENSRYGFSLNYPASWTLADPPTNNDGRTFISPEEDITCMAYGFNNALAQTLDEYVDFILESETLVERTTTTLADNIAVRIVTESDNKINEAVYALGEATGLGFYCVFANNEDRETVADNFDEMLASFQSDSFLDGDD